MAGAMNGPAGENLPGFFVAASEKTGLKFMAMIKGRPAP
jgi:hypothetical protein